MWVRVDGESGSFFTGCLANDPRAPGRMARGLRVWFGAEHIVDILRADGGQASALHRLVRCDAHGSTQPAFVCRHLATGEDLGFHAANEPGNPRPEAWCDACDQILREEGWEWTDRAEQAVRITLLCAACYDAAEARNRRAPAAGDLD